MQIRLLGPLEVRDGGRVIALPRRQQRALLAALALRAGEVVSTDRLIADLWGESAPASATGSLQNTVSALRKLIGRDALLTQAPGYRLAVGREAVDVNRFERLLTEARVPDPATRARLLREALELWRGPALADLEEEDFARLEAARLDELRVTALEERIDAELELGRHAGLVGELEQLVATHPLRERLRGQLMLALYRCGRQAEALEVYRAARLALADELGLDPSPELQELERRVLRQDPELAAPAEVTDSAPARELSELRLVTVLAATPPSADDPEQHRRRLDETLTSVRDVLDRHGGTLERFGPEGLVAVFGAEGPEDDDAMRAVLAARELGLPAGIATGEVVQGAGAVVTRAVELARVGGISLDKRTHALVRAERRLDMPFMGREDELARLRTALTAARGAGRCRVVTVVGEPGIGKTRLARELALREGAGTTVLVARCVAHGDGATFLPLLGALRRAEPEGALAGEPDADLVLARLGALAEGAPTAPLGESYWAVRRLLEALARTQPVLLVLDDVHWAEPALVDLVDYLADRTDAPLLVLCLARPELERTPGDPLTLGPLGEDDARAIVAGTAEVDDMTREQIVELAEGNPLYAEQLASFAAEGGEGLPPTLEAVLASRLGRLAPSQRTVLQRAAVVGREFSLCAVAALSGGEVARELLALSRASFVHPAAAADPGDDGYTFHHVLLRDAAYAGLTKADRAGLHERAAAWLDRDGSGDDALAGYHLEQAVRYRRELGEDADELAAAAGERLGEAGMRVWRQNDVAAAVGLLGRAVVLLPAGELRGELQWERAIALRLRDRLHDADEALSSADGDATAARSKSLRARVTCERTHVKLLEGELSIADAAAAFAGAIPNLDAAGDVRGLARAELSLCAVHHLAYRFDELETGAVRAERHYAAAGFSSGACLGIRAEALYYGAVPVGDALARCSELLERSPDRASRATVTAVLGGLRALEGACSDARLLLTHARALYEEIGSERGLLTVWTPLWVSLETIDGNHATAITEIRRSLDALQTAGDRAYASTYRVQLAELLLEGGRPDEADAYVRIAEAEALPSDVLVQFWCRSQRARVLARSGDLEEAEAVGRDAVAIASLTDGLRDRARAHFALAEVLALAGKQSGARAEVAAGRKLLRRKGATALLAMHQTPALARR
ncbi:MAG: BTAD domain-containing putative transcriptional regulator [Gaiellaceae bacterium]